MITTAAGTGNYGYSGDGGPATSAQIGAFAVAVDSADNLYVSGLSVIRKVSPAGLITTVAGCGLPSNRPCRPSEVGDGGPATDALIASTGMAIDSAGNLYLADSGSERVRKISPDGTITTVAGTGGYGYSGDGGPALSAQFGDPFALAIGRAGDLFVADRSYGAVRRLQPVGLSSPSGNGANQ